MGMPPLLPHNSMGMPTSPLPIPSECSLGAPELGRSWGKLAEAGEEMGGTGNGGAGKELGGELERKELGDAEQVWLGIFKVV